MSNITFEMDRRQFLIGSGLVLLESLHLPRLQVPERRGSYEEEERRFRELFALNAYSMGTRIGAIELEGLSEHPHWPDIFATFLLATTVMDRTHRVILSNGEGPRGYGSPFYREIETFRIIRDPDAGSSGYTFIIPKGEGTVEINIFIGSDTGKITPNVAANEAYHGFFKLPPGQLGSWLPRAEAASDAFEAQIILGSEYRTPASVFAAAGYLLQQTHSHDGDVGLVDDMPSYNGGNTELRNGAAARQSRVALLKAAQQTHVYDDVAADISEMTGGALARKYGFNPYRPPQDHELLVACARWNNPDYRPGISDGFTDVLNRAQNEGHIPDPDDLQIPPGVYVPMISNGFLTDATKTVGGQDITGFLLDVYPLRIDRKGEIDWDYMPAGPDQTAVTVFVDDQGYPCTDRTHFFDSGKRAIIDRNGWGDRPFGQGDTVMNGTFRYTDPAPPYSPRDIQLSYSPFHVPGNLIPVINSYLDRYGEIQLRDNPWWSAVLDAISSLDQSTEVAVATRRGASPPRKEIRKRLEERLLQKYVFDAKAAILLS